MIGALMLFFLADDLSASRFFPLAAGNRWVYEDTAAPGSTFESLVKAEVNPPFDPRDEALIEKPQRYFPVEMREDGKLRQVICYREHDNTLLQVGNGIDKPMVPRPLMVVSKKPFDWDYYGDSISEYLTESIHYVANSAFGSTEPILGKPHQTLVVNVTMSVGPKKVGVEIKQVWRYAADVGLYEVTEDGHVGKSKVHHVRRLTQFEAGGSA